MTQCKQVQALQGHLPNHIMDSMLFELVTLCPDYVSAARPSLGGTVPVLRHRFRIWCKFVFVLQQKPDTYPYQGTDVNAQEMLACVC